MALIFAVMVQSFNGKASKVYVNDTAALRDSNWLSGPVEQVSDQQNAVADSLLKSWTTEPFADVLVLDRDSSNGIV